MRIPARFDRLGEMVHKELLQVVRDPRLTRMVLLAPVFQLLAFGYVVSTDVRDVKLDERHDDQNGPVLPVPEELDELLSHDFADPDPVHSIAPLSSF